MRDIDAIKELRDDGYEAYIVGGAVRNKILGIPNEDIDLVTNASPDEIEEVFAGYKVDTVGKSYLVTIVEGIDISTYRMDHYSHVGDCKPVRANTLIEDLARRDLTFNAIAYDPIEDIYVDPFDGITDLENGIVRFVGDPKERIMEDPCRLLRACRFIALLGNNGFETGLMDYLAMKENCEMIREIAPERIQKEILKAMKTCSQPSIFFNELHNCGILQIILPELSLCYDFEGGKHHSETVGEHLLDTCDILPQSNPLLRVAGLFHDIGKPEVYENGKFIKHEVASEKTARGILKRLRFSNKFTDECCGIIRLHMNDVSLKRNPKGIRKLLKKCFDLNVKSHDLLCHIFADKNANQNGEGVSEEEQFEIIEMFLVQLKDPFLVLCVKDLKVDGHDMMKIGFEGKAISEVLNYLVKVCIIPENNKRNILMIHAIGFRKKDIDSTEYRKLRSLYTDTDGLYC